MTTDEWVEMVRATRDTDYPSHLSYADIASVLRGVLDVLLAGDEPQTVAALASAIDTLENMTNVVH